MITITSTSNTSPFSDILSILKVLTSCISWIIESKERVVAEKVKILGEKEQEIAGLKRILLAFESSDQRHAENILQSPATPIRGSGSIGSSTAVGALSAMYVQQSTPPSSKPPLSNATSIYPTGDIVSTPSTSDIKHSSSVRYSGAKSVLQQISPAAKQAAKLHSEVLKEVSLYLDITLQCLQYTML